MNSEENEMLEEAIRNFNECRRGITETKEEGDLIHLEKVIGYFNEGMNEILSLQGR